MNTIGWFLTIFKTGQCMRSRRLPAGSSYLTPVTERRDLVTVNCVLVCTLYIVICIES